MSLEAEIRRLRELDWRELDIKEAGIWPWSLQLICCLLLFMGIFLGMHWYLVSPAKQELQRVRDQEVELVREFRSKSLRAANLDTVRGQMEELEARMEALQEMLPTGAEVPSLLDSISEAAIDNQLSIDFIRLRSPSSQEHFIERPFDLQVRGDYHRIATFLADVASLSRIVTLHDFSLAPESDGSSNLRLSLLARTYSYRHEEEAP